MGTLIYGNGLKLEVDDQTLAHLRSVVFAKLRGQEAFPFTLVRGGAQKGGGSVSFWISPSTPVVFRFSKEEPHELSRDRIEELLKMSYENHGLVVTLPAGK